jgi:hypothetical protein
MRGNTKTEIDGLLMAAMHVIDVAIARLPASIVGSPTDAARVALARALTNVEIARASVYRIEED